MLAIRCFENVAQLRYLGTSITNENLIQEVIKWRLNSGNTWYHSVPVVLYGFETWSPALRKERRLSVFENRVLRRIFGPKRDEVTGGCRKLHNEELHNFYSSSSTYN
jgi:hypothetical protein